MYYAIYISNTILHYVINRRTYCKRFLHLPKKISIKIMSQMNKIKMFKKAIKHI